MRIGWLSDIPPFLGGAELVERDLIAAKPDGVEIVPCPPDAISQEVDGYVIHNCTSYKWFHAQELAKKPIIKQVHDVWMQGDFDLRTWLCQNAALMIFGSPLHREQAQYYVNCPTALLPVAMNLAEFKRLAMPDFLRRGFCWIGRFDTGKGILETIQWAKEQGLEVDYYGYGYHLPQVKETGRYKGELKPDEVPSIMALYEALILCPIDVEPFGRVVAEAWANGLDLVVNDNVGAMWWINNAPDQIEKGAAMWWDKVMTTIQAGKNGKVSS